MKTNQQLPLLRADAEIQKRESCKLHKCLLGHIFAGVLCDGANSSMNETNDEEMAREKDSKYNIICARSLLCQIQIILILTWKTQSI